MYDPPPLGYACTVCWYESATTVSSPAIAREIGSVRWRAAVPASTSTSRISSVAYATEDMASEEKTASATVLVRRSCRAWASDIGAPTSQRFSRLAFMLGRGRRRSSTPGGDSAGSPDLRWTRQLDVQNRRGDRQRPGLVQAEPSRIAFPEIERDGVLIRSRSETSTSLGQPDASGPEPDSRLVRRHEGIGGQSRLGHARIRSRRRHRQDAIAGAPKHHGPERERMLQIGQDLLQRPPVAQSLDELLHDSQVLPFSAGEIGQPLAAPAERRRDEPARREREERHDVIGLADGEPQVGFRQ